MAWVTKSDRLRPQLSCTFMVGFVGRFQIDVKLASLEDGHDFGSLSSETLARPTLGILYHADDKQPRFNWERARLVEDPRDHVGAEPRKMVQACL